MNESRGNKAVDRIQQRLTKYASELNYDDLTPEAIHAAKVRIIDTLGALIGGFFSEPVQIARTLAAALPNPQGASIIGTRMKTTPDLAAYVNGTTARYVELTDTYHWPGSRSGHPSDLIAPVLAAAEHSHASGRDFIVGVVLAYEAMLRVCDVIKKHGFDYTCFICLGSAIAAGKLFKLDSEQLAHCISMAVVPNVILEQVRLDHVSMYKAAAAGHAGRAAIFSALLARAGMEGPHLPFEGKAGWFEHVARHSFTLDVFGGNGTSFKICDTLIKNRPASGGNIPAVLAAEKVGPLANVSGVKQVVVETYAHARNQGGVGRHRWNIESKEDADHSMPFVTAATLIDGTLTPRSYSDGHLRDPKIRALMEKVEVIENEEFTKANSRLPQAHRCRITVSMVNGERLIGEAGGDALDLAQPKSDQQIEEKFRGLAEDVLGSRRTDAILDRLWHLDEIPDVGAIPPLLVLA